MKRTLVFSGHVLSSLEPKYIANEPVLRDHLSETATFACFLG